MSTNSIIEKWREQKHFIRFLDGNKKNCAASNLQYVSLPEAMQNFDAWTFDWDMLLTKKEQRIVMNPQWREGLIFK